MFSDTITDTTVDSPKAETDVEQEQAPEPEQPKTFDWNDPALADEAADQINPDQDADEFPPPPPDAIYTVNWDFNEPDEDKRWDIREGKKGKFLMTALVGVIVDCDDPKIPERRWVNRKLRTMITTIPLNETSSVTDFEKSIGLKADVIRISRMSKKPEAFAAHREVITQAIVEGAQGKVAVQWQASYKRTDGNGKVEYIRPGGKLNTGEKIDKSHPINNYRGMRNFPPKTKWDEDLGKEVQIKDDVGQLVRNPVVTFIDPDTGEEVEARANAEVRTFMPKR